MSRAPRALLFAVFVAVAAWVLAPVAQAQTQTPTTTAEATPEPTPTPEPTDDGTVDDGTDTDVGGEAEALPSTGASVWLYGALGISVLQLGWGLLLVEDRLRRRSGRRRWSWKLRR